MQSLHTHARTRILDGDEFRMVAWCAIKPCQNHIIRLRVGYGSNNNVCNLTKICMGVRERTAFKRCRALAIHTENEVITKNQPTDMISGQHHTFKYIAEQPKPLERKCVQYFMGEKLNI